MLAAADLPTSLVDRHYLLAGITKETYKLRADQQMAMLCEKFASTHVREYISHLRDAVAEHSDGMHPRTDCFYALATVLAERGEGAAACAVARQALVYSQVTTEYLDRWIRRLEKKAAGAVAKHRSG